MPNLPPIYVRPETHVRLNKLKAETGFPLSHIVALAVTTLDEAYDDIDELRKVLATQAQQIGMRGPVPKKPEGEQ